MIIRTYVSPNKKVKKEKSNIDVEEAKIVIKEETQIKKKNNKKASLVSSIEETSTIVEEKNEDKIDLSEWLNEENIEE